ncbi:MAG: bifunctional (p)ppGpp synthetase/guanosine-3',5'-bis(diphosphate) 3'-pyrophosphohydrolase [Candidatus Yanofskybacteria bacterium]|nr:bifunctional (p)ppGpp synthetase/guanosine-3',5'-bis(diphosphate) 3'-pyrophosphohydrolase [Candidatus Yanofskybacteria bacterium]
MDNLLTKILESPGRKKDPGLIEKAYKFAEYAHGGQKRLSGEDYITHPLCVAYFLADLGLDSPTIAAGLLHDVIEDSGITLEELKKEFGADIAFLVEGMTKLRKISDAANKEDGAHRSHFNSLKKMFFATAEDIRVILIKLADKYHNMETLKFMSKADQKRIALETLEIYAPIAARLGMGRLKGQLEDMAFPYVYPREYSWLLKKVKEKYSDRLNYIERTKPMIRRYLKDAGVAIIDLNSRAKHYYSLYQKLKRKDLDPEKIHDLVAMRIIVPDISSCYEALGVIHKHYKPLPGLIKDYIALPKPNGYQSLHTTIFCEKGRLVEIQIRTESMHDYAENGIAAHWAYSESGKTKPIAANAKEVEWVAQLKKFLGESKTGESLASLKIDFFKNRIFAFTPKGDVKDLPEGATPIDFAYAIHTDLGHTTKGAKVNGKIVSLNYELKNGDVVEIMKGKEKKPSFDWLKVVKTAMAKKAINSWLREAGDKTSDVALKTSDVQRPTETRLRTGPSPGSDVVNSRRRINAKHQPKTPSVVIQNKQTGEPLIAGQRGLLYKVAKCCNPIPGQKIAGYMTLNQGVSVHTATCTNLKKSKGDGKRIVAANWSK